MNHYRARDRHADLRIAAPAQAGDHRAVPDGRPADDVLLADPLDDEFDLDLRLGELTSRRYRSPFDAQTDPGCLPTGGRGAGTTCNTEDDTCAGTCDGLDTCPHTQCGGTCAPTCPPTCGPTCGEAHTCADTCPFTGCGDTCGHTCATCEDSCTPPCLTEGIQNTCNLMFSCVCAAHR